MQKNPTEKASQSNPLPDFYYLDNFEYLLQFVESRYSDIFSKAELNFYKEFFALKKKTRAFYVRFYNRKGIFFRLDKFSYRELGDLVPLTKDLLHHNFLTPIEAYEGDEIERFALLNLLLKGELLKLFPAEASLQELKKIGKPDLIIMAHQMFDWASLLSAIKSLGIEIVKQNFETETDLFHFLFFGRLGNSMTDFVVRDLGHIQYEEFAETDFSKRFTDRTELDFHFSVALISRAFYLNQKLYEPEVLMEWWDQELKFFDWEAYSPSHRWDRIINKFGKLCERQKELDRAIEIYRASNSPDNRERLLRLLIKVGRKDEAETICRQIIEDPSRPRDLIVAEDLLQKILGAKYLKSTTKFLKEAESIEVAYDSSVKVEELAIAHYKERGYDAWHVENYLWNALFGLTFWDVLFDPSNNAIHQPLQSRPSGLYEVGFFEGHQESINQMFKRLSSKKKYLDHLLHALSDKTGLANPFVSWHEDLKAQISLAIKLLPLKGVKAVMRQMTRQLKGNTTGFPDLMVAKGRSINFIEIKSPNDHLSEQQLFWIRFLNEQGIPAKIVRLKYEE